VSLATKYRPLRYADVLGQEATIAVCRQYVKEGKGFQQSYVFAGAHGGGKCVTGDTLVSTDRGLCPIRQLMGSEELSPTDVEVVQEGGMLAKAAFAYRGGRRDTLRIESHRGFRIEGTPNHRVRVLDEMGVLAWRRLDEIQEGDYLCLNRRNGLFGAGADLSGFVYEEPEGIHSGTFKTIPWEAPQTLTPEWGRLLGYLVGDGFCLLTNTIEINNAEEETKEEILNLLRRLTEHERETPDKCSEVGLAELRSTRKRVRTFLAYAGLGYVGAGDKEVPWSVLQSPLEVCREFLIGYFEADGHVGPGGIEISSKSEKLLRQVQLLLLQFGVVGTLRKKTLTRYGTYWRYEPDGTSQQIFADLIGFSSMRKNGAFQACVRQDHSEFDPDKRRIANLQETVPYQQGWTARFYRSLPKPHRNRGTSHLFRCRRGECALSRRVLESLVTEFLELSNDVEVREHFLGLWQADYVYDPVDRVSTGQAEVYDLNVPDGEMFAAAGLMNHNTTIARILGRALLCENSRDGEPCDECPQCAAMLADKAENLIEVDAATNSGKEDMKRITEEAQFGSFSGRRKIYVLDECFTEDTMLLTPEGPQSIKELVERRYGGLVATIDGRGVNTWRPVTNWHDIRDERECVRLEFESGVLLTVTLDQEVFAAEGAWVGASDFAEGSRVAGSCWHRPTQAVRVRQDSALIRRVPVGKQKVYDITVEDTHAFLAWSRHGGDQCHAVLAHNCHELSRQAMDALLKPLEDNRRGTNEKQIVCLFCTTEPEKMRPAILSRCAPLFRIRANTPDEIAARLRHICKAEGIDHDPDVLSLIAEVTECHVRDAIQAVEGVSMLGRVDRDNVARYLHLDANALYLDLLEKLGSDLPALLATIEKLDQKVSPAVCYERMADVCMLAYRLVNLGEASVPSYWDRQKLEAAGKLHQEFLIEFAQRFAQRPVRSTSAMFACDVSALHQRRAGIVVRADPLEVVVPSTTQARVSSDPIEPSPKPMLSDPSGVERSSASVGSMRADSYLTETGVAVNPNAQNVRRTHEKRQPHHDEILSAMSADDFVKTLRRRVLELLEEQTARGRSARRDDLGDPGTHTSR
jgi:DNA polymerase III gamma/tau subunit/intein/homing endonuclease